MSTYRPQSPDLSSFAPRSPQLSTTTTATYRPQSPDLSGLGPPDYNQQYQPQSQYLSGYNSTYQGPTSSAFTATSVPAQPIPQVSYNQPYPQYDMMPSSRMKTEDGDYLPDAPSRRSLRQQQQQTPQPSYYEPDEPSNGYLPEPIPQQQRPSPQQFQPQPPPAASTKPSDPTHGVTLKTSFPVARIKRIMQADEDIGKVAQVTPHAVSRALELFMIKLISASAEQARGTGAGGKGPKRVLAQHMKAAIKADDTFDFLAEIIAKVPDAPASGKAKKEAGSESDEGKGRKKGKKRKDSGDDF